MNFRLIYKLVNDRKIKGMYLQNQKNIFLAKPDSIGEFRFKAGSPSKSYKDMPFLFSCLCESLLILFKRICPAFDSSLRL